MPSSSIFEIKNVAFANKGAELMLIAIESRLRKIAPSARIALQPGKRSPFDDRVRYGAYQKISGTKGFFDWSWVGEMIPGFLKRNLGMVSDNMLAGIFDASGYAYGGSWNPAMLRQAARQAALMRRKNGVYILMPQAFGPFKTQHQKRKIRELVNAATIVFARDAQSKLYLEQAEVDLNKVRVFPDFTASVPPLETAIPSGDYACIVPNVKLISRMNESAAGREDYIDLLIKCIDHFRDRDIQPVFLYHHTQDDNIIHKRVAPKLDDEILLVDETDPRKLKFILGHAQINICSRYHACISSLSQGVPALATSWSHKYEMLYQDFGVPELLVDNSSAASNVIDHVLTSHAAFSLILIEKTKKIKMKIDVMWDMVSELMNR